jgi:hypothetical protein
MISLPGRWIHGDYYRSAFALLIACAYFGSMVAARAGVGDPQVATDHQWYPGELSCSTFDRLFATQAALYARVTGGMPVTDEEKALAAWLWRNTHYFHGEEGAEDLWGKGFGKGGDSRSREYWTGLFAHGFGLCGTTHSQWVAEMHALFGHGRGRGVGAAGHNTFEVFLTGGKYGEGKWVLLDHDLSTIAFDEEGAAMLSVAEVQRDWKRLLDRGFKPERQRGWPVCGLHPRDSSSFAEYNVAEYFAGYAGLPPMVHLRRGETLRRYLEPGLDDGKTYVFWGRNYQTQGIPGPERSLTWVNQPEKLFRSVKGAPFKPGQARFGNAVFSYRPNFADGTYREGAVEDTDGHVTLEFRSPFIIAATPPSDAPWGIYEPGGRNGLVVQGAAGHTLAVSVDRGATWNEGSESGGAVDLTDFVKGHRQYFLRIGAPATALKDSRLAITTICQANPSTIPRLRDDGSVVRFEASGNSAVSAGPTLPQARAHVVGGAFGTPAVALEIKAPRGEGALSIHAAAHVASGNPPDPKVKYHIESSTDGGKTWAPIVADWVIPRRGDEPKEFWSQSMCWGEMKLPSATRGPVQVRFRNTGGRQYLRAEAHLVYRTKSQDRTRVTFAWADAAGDHAASHVFNAAEGEWKVPTQAGTRTKWVQFEPISAE